MHPFETDRLDEPPYGLLLPLQPLACTDERLQKLASDMVPRSIDGEDAQLAAGYTYFGQIVAHDVSFFRATRGRTGGATNARTPALDLDGVYGGGPATWPAGYERGRPSRFLIGGRQDRLLREHDHRQRATDDDVLRNRQGTPLIPDPRNDATVMTSQLHLALMKAHNRRADERRHAGEDETAAFDGARADLVRTYQHLVLRDFLPRVVDAERRAWLEESEDRARAGRAPRHRLKELAGGTFLPLEFVLAAFRFGHSMVRPSYRLNAGTPKPLPLVPPHPWEHASSFGHLMGFDVLPNGWTLDWELFFPLEEVAPQPALRIDDRVTPELANLPRSLGPGASLPYRTLAAGAQWKLPSGESVAGFLGQDSLRDKASTEPETPLWCWLLREAAAASGGEHLGPVGSTLVAETLFRLIAADPDSVLEVPAGWSPLARTVGELCEYGWGATLTPRAAPDDAARSSPARRAPGSPPRSGARRRPSSGTDAAPKD